MRLAQQFVQKAFLFIGNLIFLFASKFSQKFLDLLDSLQKSSLTHHNSAKEDLTIDYLIKLILASKINLRESFFQDF